MLFICTHTLSVTFSISWWPRQWRSAADCQSLTRCSSSSLTQWNLMLFFIGRKLYEKVSKINIVKHNKMLLLITVSHLTSYALKVSQSKVSTLNKWSGNLNYCSMAYTLSNICTQNYWNRIIIIKIIVGGWVVWFLRYNVYKMLLLQCTCR